MIPLLFGDHQSKSLIFGLFSESVQNGPFAGAMAAIMKPMAADLGNLPL
jgi:hypothetical protein